MDASAAPSSTNADQSASTDATKPVNDDSKQIHLQVNVEHLDWKSIKQEETEDTFANYKKSLGLFVGLTNT